MEIPVAAAVMLTAEQKDYLAKIYFDPSNPVAYSGLEKTWNFIKKEGKVTKKQLKEWLLEQDTYTSYFPVRRTFKRPKTISPRKNYVWGSDVAFMLPFASKNDDYAYFVVFIDIFTRYAYAEPLKTVRGREMLGVMQSIFEQQKPEHLYTDSGVEYTNKLVQAYLKRENIDHYTSKSEKKVAHAERLIKQLKRKLLQYMNEKNTYKWVDVLPDVVNAYNNSYHSVIKMTPAQAQSADQYRVWANQYFSKPKETKPVSRPKRKKTPFTFNVGDRVKLVGIKKPFDREYDEKYTTEIFTITNRRMQGNIPSYTVKDELNEEIVGWFYPQELLRVFVPDDKKYKIEKVLKKRRRAGRNELLVKWRNWPDKFNSWVSEVEYL